MSVIIITGVTGFLGSNLARSLLSDGHKIIALKRRNSNLHRILDIERDIIFYDVDNLEITKIFTVHGRVNIIIHAATAYGRGEEKALDVVGVNVIFPLKILEAGINFKIDAFINVDSFYSGPANPGLRLPAYSLSKRQFSEWGRSLAEKNGIRFINLRLEHLYGPGDSISKFTAWIVYSCINNINSIELTSGSQKRDFIFIKDAVSAFQVLIGSINKFSMGYAEFQLGTGKSISIRDFVEMVKLYSKSPIRLDFGFIPDHHGEINDSIANNKGLLDLGWKVSYMVESGVREYVDAEILNVKL